MSMSTIAPPSLVTGAPRVPLPFGLFSVLVPRENSGDRWLTGVNWETLTCEPIGGIGAAQCDTDDILGLPKDLDKMDADLGEASPFTVYGHHTCSPIGNSAEYAQEQANAHLATREEAEVERALWTGNLGNVPNFAGANGYPALAVTSTFALADAWLAVAELEQTIAEKYGSQGVIHVSRRNAFRLIKSGAIKVNGLRLQTALGTPVVAGTGYGSEKIVVTPALFGYRSEVFNSSGREYDLLDRATNDMHAIAERTYLLGFDPCGATAAPLTDPEGA